MRGKCPYSRQFTMTFQEIIDRVFLKLDTSKEIDGDLYDDVLASLKDIYDEVVTEIRPDELLTSKTYTLLANDDEVPLNIGGFLITDFEKEHALFIDDADEPWINVDYRSWLRGDDKRSNLWTLHNDTVMLATSPPTGDTWALELFYYKTPATIVLTNSPEFRREHHSALVWGVLTKFPHFFQGDKEILLLKYEKDYANAKAQAKRTHAASQQLRSLHPKAHQASTGDIVFSS